MSEKSITKTFENKDIRTIWNDEEEKYYFSVVDVISVLTNSMEPRRYWSDLKIKLNNEGSELYEKIVQLKMRALDGKNRITDACDTEQLLRLIQSIPSPKAEPFKLWLAQLGNERIDETFDPEIAIQRAISIYRKKGYSKEWIESRLKTITNRNKLTNAWYEHGVTEDIEYGILTNEIYKMWSGFNAKEYKQFKNLKKESLRDNMTDTELALNNLAEVATRELVKEKNPLGLDKNKYIDKQGGSVAKNARVDLEEKLGKPVLSSNNSKDNKYIEQ